MSLTIASGLSNYPKRTGTLRLGDISPHPKGPFRPIRPSRVRACARRLRADLALTGIFTVQDAPGFPLLDGYRRKAAYRQAFPDNWTDREVPVVFLACIDVETSFVAWTINYANGERYTPHEALASLLRAGPQILCPDDRVSIPEIAARAAQLDIPLRAAIAAVRQVHIYGTPNAGSARSAGPVLDSLTRHQVSTPSRYGATPPAQGQPSALVQQSAAAAGLEPPASLADISVARAMRNFRRLLAILQTWPDGAAPEELRPTLLECRNEIVGVLRDTEVTT